MTQDMCTSQSASITLLQSAKVMVRSLYFPHKKMKTMVAGVMRANVNVGGKYENQIVPAMSMANFLNRTLKPDEIVDSLWLDMEGPEYNILPQFFANQSLSLAVICQINVEIHGAMDQFTTFLSTESAYLGSKCDQLMKMNVFAGCWYRIRKKNRSILYTSISIYGFYTLKSTRNFTV